MSPTFRPVRGGGPLFVKRAVFEHEFVKSTATRLPRSHSERERAATAAAESLAIVTRSSDGARIDGPGARLRRIARDDACVQSRRDFKCSSNRAPCAPDRGRRKRDTGSFAGIGKDAASHPMRAADDGIYRVRLPRPPSGSARVFRAEYTSRAHAARRPNTRDLCGRQTILMQRECPTAPQEGSGRVCRRP